jgi:hypothetical protein
MRDMYMKKFDYLFMIMCVALTPLAAVAAPKRSEMVKVGAFSKRTTGVVKSITDGDQGCYYELKDAKGRSFTETAGFELCDPKFKRLYKGKKVFLSYKVEKVMADDCEGNPECTRHKNDAVVKKIKVIK